MAETPTLEYHIAPEIFDAHPGYCRGIIVFDAVDNRGSAEPLAGLLRDAEAQARAAVPAGVAEHPRIAAWREAYRRFGAKPSEHRSSIEAMLRRVLKPAPLPTISPLVDIGNIVSLRYLLPVGVHPLPAATLVLRPAAADDGFAPADGGAQELPPDGEIVLACGHQVLTRRWTWRQAAGTQTLPDSTCVFVNVDGLPPASTHEVRAAMQECVALVRQHCGGGVRSAEILDATRPAMRLA